MQQKTGFQVIFAYCFIILISISFLVPQAIGQYRQGSAVCATVSNTNDSGAGSLRQAIADCPPGETILFASGLAGGTITLSSELFLSKNVTIDATDAAGLALSGGNAVRVLNVNGGVIAELREVTIRDGASINGGGIYNNGELTLTNVTVRDNVENSVGPADWQKGGGGIHNVNILTLNNSAVFNNSSNNHDGGGIYSYQFTTLTINHSAIYGNTATNVAGGIRSLGNTTIYNSTISGNTGSAWEGGGIFHSDGLMTLAQVTVTDNTGGAGNSGGIFAWSGVVTYQNSIIVNNAGAECGVNTGSFTSNGYNLFNTGPMGCPTSGTDLTSAAPGLNALADNGGATWTHALQASSPAIDAVPDGMNDCVAGVTVDQRGAVRANGVGQGGSGCDIGAYEFDSTIANLAPVANDDSGVTPPDTPLSVSAPGVLGNDTDPNGDGLTAVLNTPPTPAQSFTLNSDGSYDFIPTSGFTGIVTFTYHANDGALDSNVATVTITVDIVPNDPPVATADNYVTSMGVPLNEAAPGVLGNDTDGDGDGLTAVLDTPPTNALSFALNSDGSFDYTPNNGWTGVDSFSYHAYDGVAASNVVTATINVTSVVCPAGAVPALPGIGCYRTSAPGGSTISGSPATTNNFTGWIDTNNWSSSLIWKWGAENHSAVMTPHPFSMQAESDGLRLAHVVDAVDTGNAAHYSFGTEHAYVTVNGLNASQTLVEKVTDWMTVADWTGGGQNMQATLGHGMPYVYFEKTTAGEFHIKFAGAMNNITNVGEVLAITPANNCGCRRYAFFGPPGSTWTTNTVGQRWAELNDPTGKNYMVVAVLPTTDDTRLEYFRQHAYNFITDTTATYEYDQAKAEVTTTFTVGFEAKESGAGYATTPLLALYRHQWLYSSATVTGDTYVTSRGEMRVIASDTFTTAVTLDGILTTLPDVANGAGYSSATLQSYVSAIYNPAHNYSQGQSDTYWVGKDLNRAAQLAMIADQQGMITERDSFLTYLKNTLEDWFDGSASTPHFYYDSNWTVLNGYPASFNADVELNDHHFHYGYFIYAAAIIAQYDPAWAASYEGSVNLLIKDTGNWDRNDTQFPYSRHFDPYAGHGWANGPSLFGTGNNQESSSEAMNYYQAVTLWGANIGDNVIRDHGIYMYTSERTAIEQYWFDVDEQVFPPEFPYEVVGILWGDGQTHTVWWSNNPEEIHGIQVLPVTGGSLYLGRRPDYVNRNIAELVAEGGVGPSRLWQDIIAQFRAFDDPAGAISMFNAGYGVEQGETLAHTYHWLHNMDTLGTFDTVVTADIPTYAVFDQGGTLTYAAYNPTDAAICVNYSDGAGLDVPARSLASGDGSDTCSCAPPADLTDVSIEVAVNEVKISWSDVGADEYLVYRDTQPYFSIGTGSYVGTATSPYTHSNGAGDAATNYYYHIVPNNLCGSAANPSVGMSAFDFAVVPGG